MRRNNILRTSVALAAVTALLGACSESSADPDDKAAEGPSSASPSPADETPVPAEETSAPTEESSAPAAKIALPDGVLRLPPPDADGEALPLDAGRYQILLSDTLALEIDLLQGTFAHSDGLYLESEDGVVKVEAATDVYGVPTEPCTDQFPIPVGPTVPDLVDAISTAPIYRVSSPEPVEVGGAKGTHLQIRVPAAYNADACHSSEVGMPGNPTTYNNMPPGYVGDWWILDVDGQRVVAQQFCFDTCRGDAEERLTRSVRSITFTPSA